MINAIYGTKLGMTQIFSDDDRICPCHGHFGGA
jgi:ribosomal protein L3